MRRDEILVAGYPQGGDSLSITKGIVSRVVMTRYAHSSNKLLGIQIDAAINPGNSVRRASLHSKVQGLSPQEGLRVPFAGSQPASDCHVLLKKGMRHHLHGACAFQCAGWTGVLQPPARPRRGRGVQQAHDERQHRVWDALYPGPWCNFASSDHASQHQAQVIVAQER